MLPELLPIVLVHGGLYEGMTVKEFWADPGVLGELRAKHLKFLAPQRPAQPLSWDDEEQILLAAIDNAGHDRVALVGASNGCSVAARLAIAHPDRVARMMLAWPATVGDKVVDELLRIIITDEADEDAAEALLKGETLRGVTDAQLSALDLPVVIYPSMPENQVHQRSTIMGLLAVINGAFLVGGSPEPPDDNFADHLDDFISMVTEFGRVEHDD